MDEVDFLKKEKEKLLLKSERMKYLSSQYLTESSLTQTLDFQHLHTEEEALKEADSQSIGSLRLARSLS
ncbi:hypothetical protein HDU96_002498 [Phlyctochytrium bullatum]|nr:hypothetical protein HDU96_002498 [Phlyctochytrium bullatum]